MTLKKLRAAIYELNAKLAFNTITPEEYEAAQTAIYIKYRASRAAEQE